jgi:hypothetical protein
MNFSSLVSIPLVRVGFPLLRYKSANPKEPPFDVAGTCFSIGGGYFVTAGHVVDGIREDKGVDTLVGILSEDERHYYPVEIEDLEQLPTDIGILKLSNLEPYSSLVHALPWYVPSFWAGVPLFSPGFGAGMVVAGNTRRPIVRFLHGNIAAAIREFQPVGSGEAPFYALELTCQVPRRHSGAPLVLGGSSRRGCIIGVLFGTSSTESVAFSIREEEEGEAPYTYERVETYHSGVAVPCEIAINLQSSLLGGTIRDHLNKSNMVIETPMSPEEAM